MRGLPTILPFVAAHLSSSVATAFSSSSSSSPRRTLILPASASTQQTTSLQASPLQDVFSGITGFAPSSIEPPTDLLIGTSIDPTRGDVELER
eukprot:scaffold33100_cov61-Skeletonema_dohrnii-CCMP3373.AAC.1